MSGPDIETMLFNCCQAEVIGDAIEVARNKLATLSNLEIETGAYANAFSPQTKNTWQRLNTKLTRCPEVRGSKKIDMILDLREI
jgi:S-methylmethionine-dependent homocysteine/selenocysteine methylase